MAQYSPSLLSEFPYHHTWSCRRVSDGVNICQCWDEGFWHTANIALLIFPDVENHDVTLCGTFVQNGTKGRVNITVLPV